MCIYICVYIYIYHIYIYIYAHTYMCYISVIHSRSATLDGFIAFRKLVRAIRQSYRRARSFLTAHIARTPLPSNLPQEAAGWTIIPVPSNTSTTTTPTTCRVSQYQPYILMIVWRAAGRKLGRALRYTVVILVTARTKRNLPAAKPITKTIRTTSTSITVVSTSRTIAIYTTRHCKH